LPAPPAKPKADQNLWQRLNDGLIFSGKQGMVEMGAPPNNPMGKIEQGVVAIMAKNRETSI
jgi:hypothetical protein